MSEGMFSDTGARMFVAVRPMVQELSSENVINQDLCKPY